MKKLLGLTAGIVLVSSTPAMPTFVCQSELRKLCAGFDKNKLSPLKLSGFYDLLSKQENFEKSFLINQIENLEISPKTNSKLLPALNDVITNSAEAAVRLPTRLPENLPENIKSGLNALREFLRNTTEVLTFLKSLEKEILELISREGLKPEEALEQILAAGERLTGFRGILDLEDRYYVGPEWRAMLKQGWIFRDTAFANRLHGAQNHRIQLELCRRKLNAGGYRGTSLAAFGLLPHYLALGDEEIHQSLIWASSIPAPQRSLWFQIFDSAESNATRPEFLTMLIKDSDLKIPL